MNKVSITTSSGEFNGHDCWRGDIFKYRATGEIFILGSFIEDGREKFVAIGFKDGNRFNGANFDRKVAVQGLEYVGRNLQIQIIKDNNC